MRVWLFMLATPCRLPAALRARVEESVLLETPTGLGDHPLFPHVRVVEYKPKRGLETQAQAGPAVAEPLLVDVESEPATETFIEIIDWESGNRVVTVIEFLSPSNQSPGPNMRKQGLAEKGLRPGKKPPRRRTKPKRR